MAPKKPAFSLRRPAEVVDPLQADRFVRGMAPDPTPVAPPPTPTVAPAAVKAPEVETSERPNVQTSGASKSLVYRKRTDDVRRRMTIYLSEDLSRRLRLYAAEKDQDYSLVLAEALDALLDRKGVR
ncbi:MAG: hypothetical protein EPO40_32770 [Myxococcaceae bacterium]|nr:MAG: hypothetical protein EPO40_32770 [Myxococcaceae bacterium]